MSLLTLQDVHPISFNVKYKKNLITKKKRLFCQCGNFVIWDQAATLLSLTIDQIFNNSDWNMGDILLHPCFNKKSVVHSSLTLSFIKSCRYNQALPSDFFFV